MTKDKAIASIEAEQSVLGALMIDPRAIDQVADMISRDDFYRRSHAAIFDAIIELDGSSLATDAVMVSERLRTNGTLDEAGGLAYIASIVNNTPSSANVLSYAKIVRDKAIERGLILATNEITKIVYGDGDTRDKLDRSQAIVMSIADKSASDGPMTVRQAMPAVIDEIDRRFHSQGLLGLSTGFLDLDEKTSGLQRGDLILIAGRPSMGKSTLAGNIAEHVAIHEKKTALVFSMEMSREQVLMRSISSVGRIDFQRVRTAKLLDEEWPRLTQATTTRALHGSHTRRRRSGYTEIPPAASGWRHRQVCPAARWDTSPIHPRHSCSASTCYRVRSNLH